MKSGASRDGEEAEDGRTSGGPEDAAPAGVVKRHGRYALGALALLAILAWLTFDEVHPDPVLLGIVAILAVVYRMVATDPRLSHRSRQNLVFLSLAAGLVVILGVLSDWNTQQIVFILTPVLFYAIFALGLNLEFGYTGIINFGHVAFMAIGAYTMAILGVPMIAHAEYLSGPSVGGIALVVAAAAIAFLIVGVFASIFTEKAVAWKVKRSSREGGRRRGATTSAGERGAAGDGGKTAGGGGWVVVAVGAAAGLLAAGVVVWVVPYPMTPMWAQTSVIGVGLVAGMVLAAIAGVLMGLPTLRLRADYLAIVTIGAAEILRRFARNEDWLTGGPRGIYQLPRPFSEAGAQWGWLEHLGGALGVPEYWLLLFLLALAALLLVLMGFAVLLRAPYGRVLRAIREDEDEAAALGKNVFAYKLQALAIGSAVAALAGAFLAWHRTFISPETFLPLITFYAWIIIVVGGVGNNKGTILGALILFSFFEITRSLNLDENLGLSGPQGSALRVTLIGVLLILMMLFKPEGLLGRREELVLGD